MKKGNKLWIIAVLVLLMVIGCKKTERSNAEPSSQSVVEQIKEASANIISSEAANATIEAAEQTTQTVFVPVPQQSSSNLISIDYKSPCLVQKYKGLNVYCRAKTAWHNYSTLTSWYVPYTLVLLALVIALFVIWLMRRNKG